jgi:hypothetical protein
VRYSTKVVDIPASNLKERNHKKFLFDQGYIFGWLSRIPFVQGSIKITLKSMGRDTKESVIKDIKN